MSFFRPLAVPDVEVWTLLYGGRDLRHGDPFALTAEEVAEEASDAARALTDDSVPTAMLGHSMGVAVAVEIMRAAAPQLDLLALSARPCTPDDHDGRREVEKLIADDVGITAWLSKIGGTPAELLDNAEFMSFYLPVLKADLRLSARYRAVQPPTPITSVPILLMCGHDDPVVNMEQMSAWEAWTSGRVMRHEWNGGHHAVVQNPNDTLRALFGGVRLGFC